MRAQEPRAERDFERENLVNYFFVATRARMVRSIDIQIYKDV